MIRILVIELNRKKRVLYQDCLNESLKQNYGALTILEPCSVCCELKNVENLYPRYRNQSLIKLSLFKNSFLKQVIVL